MTEQERYQVRFDWGSAGADAVGADADVVVWVDAVPNPAILARPLPDLPVPDLPVPDDALPERLPGEWLLSADFRAAPATASWVAALQQRLGRRITIAVVAAGDRRADGALRFAVEDQLAAGAVIDALGALGIDATSPEAAACEAAYRGLGRAVGHLLTASVTAASVPVTPAIAKTDPDAEAVVLRTPD